MPLKIVQWEILDYKHCRKEKEIGALFRRCGVIGALSHSLCYIPFLEATREGLLFSFYHRSISMLIFLIVYQILTLNIMMATSVSFDSMHCSYF